MRKETPWGTWDAVGLAELNEILRGLEVPWHIAGGYAIEAFVGGAFREHEDIDVGIAREDQLAAQRHLLERGWEIHCADPPGSLRRWLPGEALVPGVHDIWVRRHETEPWRFQLMLDESVGDEWVYRRDPRIRRPWSRLTFQIGGVNYLLPEIQLLFKSNAMRPRDEDDFEMASPLLDVAARRWLREALELTGPGHPWTAKL